MVCQMAHKNKHDKFNCSSSLTKQYWENLTSSFSTWTSTFTHFQMCQRFFLISLWASIIAGHFLCNNYLYVHAVLYFRNMHHQASDWCISILAAFQLNFRFYLCHHFISWTFDVHVQRLLWASRISVLCVDYTTNVFQALHL